MTAAGRVIVRPAAAAAFLAGGLAAGVLGYSPVSAHTVWTAGLWLIGLPLLLRTGWGVLHGRFAADLVAALAVLGAMVLDQPLAGLVIVLMQTGGEALEQFAERRASAAVRELEADAPHQAHRLEHGEPVDLAADQVLPGDRILVRPGEMVPCDGSVESGSSKVDVSRLFPKRAGGPL